MSLLPWVLKLTRQGSLPALTLRCRLRWWQLGPSCLNRARLLEPTAQRRNLSERTKSSGKFSCFLLLCDWQSAVKDSMWISEPEAAKHLGFPKNPARVSRLQSFAEVPVLGSPLTREPIFLPPGDSTESLSGWNIKWVA